MSAPVPPQTTEAPSTAPPGSEPPRDAQGRFTAWTAPETAPLWARGKTPEEILGIATQAVDNLSRFVTQPPNPAPVTAPAPAPTPSYQMNPDEYLTGADLMRAAPQLMSQYVGPQVQAGLAVAASTAVNIVRDRHRDVVDRYRPEFESMVANLPLEQRTVDNVEWIVKLVKANHLDELARERAQQLQATEPTMRSQGGAGLGPANTSTNPLDDANIDAEWKAKAQQVGVTLDTIKEFCAKNGMTVDAYFKMLAPRTIGEGR